MESRRGQGGGSQNSQTVVNTDKQRTAFQIAWGNILLIVFPLCSHSGLVLRDPFYIHKYEGKQ